MFKLNFIDKKMFIAPMAGGVSTPNLVISACESGASGFLAAGYKTPEKMLEEIKKVKSSIDFPFGVNIFVPSAIYNVAKNKEEIFNKYKEKLIDGGFGEIISKELMKSSDDFFKEKLNLLTTSAPVPIVSFTFGIPEQSIINDLHKANTFVIVTVTSETEAKLVLENYGVDGLCVQGIEAGGHRASFLNNTYNNMLNLKNLLKSVRSLTRIPIIATGGISRKEHIKELIELGADAVQIGTLFVPSKESGASELYKRALFDKEFKRTTLTKAFTGKLARGIENEFVNKYSDDAPSLYPEIHFLTSKIRSYSYKNNDKNNINIWAGTSYKDCVPDLSTQEIIEKLYF